ncbi:flagella basal body P-ring formation protein FlgA [bacterium]|nr:flagella basal body P-ring formation protein FlgA [bacterium]
MLGMITILIGFFIGHGDSLDAKLKNYLEAKLNSFVKYEYQIVQQPKNYSRIEINYEKQSRLTKNYFYIPVTVYDLDNLPSNALLTVRVKLYKNVLVALNEIRRGENLSQNLFEVTIEDVAMYDGKTVNIDANLSNYRSKTSVKARTILSKEMIEPAPIVSKGDKVILHTGGTGVDVSMDVIARQDGCVGDVISVYANGSKLYKAKIVDKSNLTLVE